MSLSLCHQSKQDHRECMGSESGRSHCDSCGREKGYRVDAVIKCKKKSGTLVH
jgi:hypothetical protein